MPLYEINGKLPKIGNNTWVAPSADIIGEVSIGDNCYIGFGAVIRADFGPVTIGNQTLVEENCVIHNGNSTRIGSRVIIGHMAMIHDAVIHDSCLVGMKSMLCDKSEMGPFSIVAEQTLVQTGQKIPSGTIYGGSPARYVKDVMEHHKQRLAKGLDQYMALIEQYQTDFKQHSP